MVALHYFLLNTAIWTCNRHLELNISEAEFLIFTPESVPLSLYCQLMAILSSALVKNLGVIFLSCFFPPLPHLVHKQIFFSDISRMRLLFTTYTAIPWSKSLSCVPLLFQWSKCFSCFHSCLLPTQQPDRSNPVTLLRISRGSLLTQNKA